jgi:ribosomal protein S17
MSDGTQAAADKSAKTLTGTVVSSKTNKTISVSPAIGHMRPTAST